jgi:hypothetical protein
MRERGECAKISSNQKILEERSNRDHVHIPSLDSAMSRCLDQAF